MAGVEESDGIHYYQEGKDLRNAGYSLDGYWYYFDADGVMKQNSFRQKNGQSFYYDGEGHLVLNEELDIKESTINLPKVVQLIQACIQTAQIHIIIRQTAAGQKMQECS